MGQNKGLLAGLAALVVAGLVFFAVSSGGDDGDASSTDAGNADAAEDDTDATSSGASSADSGNDDGSADGTDDGGDESSTGDGSASDLAELVGQDSLPDGAGELLEGIAGVVDVSDDCDPPFGFVFDGWRCRVFANGSPGSTLFPTNANTQGLDPNSINVTVGPASPVEIDPCSLLPDLCESSPIDLGPVVLNANAIVIAGTLTITGDLANGDAFVATAPMDSPEAREIIRQIADGITS